VPAATEIVPPPAPIACVLPDLKYGGAERIALTLIRSLVDRGCPVDLVLMERKGELLDQLPGGVRVVDLGAGRIRGTIGPLVRYLKERRPRSMQVRMWPLTVAAIIARALSGVKTRLVVSDHAILSDHYRSRATQAALKLTTRLFYPLADARVSVSQGAAKDLASLSGLPLNSFTVIHNPAEFPAKVASNAAAEALWGEGRPRILTVGKLKEEKDQQLLVRAFARLAGLPDARLMIAGDGPLLEPLQSLARELGVGERMIFPGYIADPWPLYASADLFALPSREESFGNVLTEALHAGLPVVSTSNTGATEILDGGRYGALVPGGDADALARTIELTLAEPHDAEAGRARAKALGGDASVDAYHRLLLA
jgi:glycosyltransferase involved in cell wall biosynthesis